MLNEFQDQVQDVYGALGEAVDSEGEEELDQVMNMRRGGGGGGGGGAEESMFAASASMSMRAAPQKSAASSGSMKKKSKVTSSIGGSKRLNDEVSTKLYKMSKKA